MPRYMTPRMKSRHLQNDWVEEDELGSKRLQKQDLLTSKDYIKPTVDARFGLPRYASPRFTSRSMTRRIDEQAKWYQEAQRSAKTTSRGSKRRAATARAGLPSRPTGKDARPAPKSKEKAPPPPPKPPPELVRLQSEPPPPLVQMSSLARAKFQSEQKLKADHALAAVEAMLRAEEAAAAAPPEPEPDAPPEEVKEEIPEPAADESNSDLSEYIRWDAAMGTWVGPDGVPILKNTGHIVGRRDLARTDLWC